MDGAGKGERSVLTCLAVPIHKTGAAGSCLSSGKGMGLLASLPSVGNGVHFNREMHKETVSPEKAYSSYLGMVLLQGKERLDWWEAILWEVLMRNNWEMQQE